MYVTKNTDYSLRTLMLLALQPDDTLMSIEEISEALGVSRAHLMKVVNQLATHDLVETVRGRNGGVRVHRPHHEINVGTVFRQLDEVNRIIDCEDGPCVFNGSCTLDVALKSATRAFLEELDNYTLADLVKRKTRLKKLIAVNIR